MHHMAAPQLSFTAKHWTALGAFIVSVFGLVAMEPDWTHVLTTKFIGTIGVNTGAFMVAMFSNKQPESTRKRRDRILAERYGGHPPIT